MGIRSSIAGGGFSGRGRMRETTINFGSIPVSIAKFTISDANVRASSIIHVTQSANAASGKGADENEGDQFAFSARPSAGSFVLIVRALSGAVAGNFKIFYEVR
jgi:hypothetical protein